MTCVTEGRIEPIENVDLLNPSVDHICLDRELATWVTAVRGLSVGETLEGKRLNDHTGVVVDVALP